MKDVLSAAPTLGVRRLTLIAVQLLTELSLAQLSRLCLAPVSLSSVRLARPGTPFEQAIIPRSDEPWHSAQETEGLTALGALVSELLDKRLYLEDSLPDRPARFGGMPWPRQAARLPRVVVHDQLSLSEEPGHGPARSTASLPRLAA